MLDTYPEMGYIVFMMEPMKVKEDTLDLFYGTPSQHVAPFNTQLLKWIGNKQRFAHEIASYFPKDIKTYYEPFLGSTAVLAALRGIQNISNVKSLKVMNGLKRDTTTIPMARTFFFFAEVVMEEL